MFEENGMRTSSPESSSFFMNSFGIPMIPSPERARSIALSGDLHSVTFEGVTLDAERSELNRLLVSFSFSGSNRFPVLTGFFLPGGKDASRDSI